MSGEGMPKRNRADSADGTRPRRVAEVVEVTDSPTTQPVSMDDVETTSVQDELDPLLEQQLDALDVDDDFRGSIRAMTPNTRQEVLNDIIRHQQQVDMADQLHAFTGHMPAPQNFLFTGEEEDEASEGEEGEEGEEPADWEDLNHEHDYEAMRDNAHPQRMDFSRFFGPNVVSASFGSQDGSQLNFNAGTVHSLDDDGHYRMHTFGEQQERPATMVDFLQMIAQHFQAQPSGDSASYARMQQQRQRAMEERMMTLQNLVGMLHQASAMQNMGLDRDIDDMSYEELLELEERIGNVSKGVPPMQLESCMTVVKPASPEDTCPICQEELTARAPSSGETLPASSTTASNTSNNACVKLRNCPHVFHKSCVKQWLTSNKTCPVCKQEVLPQSASSP